MRNTSELRLGVVSTVNPDWPEITISVDGRDPFAEVAPGWTGFDPSDIVGAAQPLVPTDVGRRVAVRGCSCGIAGCGVIAPWIAAENDGSIVWSDFRDYTGVFDGSTFDGPVEWEGKSWELPDIVFDRRQYLAEVQRVSSDRGWETPRREIARRVREQMAEKHVVFPGGHLDWVVPAWRDDGIAVSFGNNKVLPGQRPQILLKFDYTEEDPQLAANEILNEMIGVDVSDWPRRFGWDR